MTLQYGMSKSNLVWNAQILLNYYSAWPLGPIPVDGDFGPETLDRVKKIQQQQGMKQTGFIDLEFVNRLVTFRKLIVQGETFVDGSRIGGATRYTPHLDSE